MTLPMGSRLACMILLLAAASAIAAPAVDRSPSANDASRARAALAGWAVPFQANIGQDDPRVAFTARTFAGTLFVTRDGQLVHSLHGKLLGETERADAGPVRAGRKRDSGWALTETLVGARPVPRGAEPGPTRVSRFTANARERGSSEVPTFERVSFGEAWPGIQVDIAARGRNVEKIFTVAPGADVRRIAVRMRGANRLALAADGSLLAHTGNGPVSFTAPIAWQDIDGLRHPVKVAYALSGHRYGFKVGPHDRAHPVVIDPLMGTTYLGGAADDGVNGMTITANGTLYVVGTTASSTFPWTYGGAQPALRTVRDGFVARLGNLGEDIRVTYLGGSDDDIAVAVAVGGNGDVYVAGHTRSTDFPSTTGGAQPAKAIDNEFDGFVARFSNDLGTLVQSTYFGGGRGDFAAGIAVDAGGNVYIAGSTASSTLPGTAGAAQPSHSTQTDSFDAFVAKFDGTLTSLARATYLGGGGSDIANGLALDAHGNVFVAGHTSSTNFPGTAGGAQPTFAGAAGKDDAFVARLNGALTVLTQATFLGGNQTDRATAIVLDASGNAFVAGRTQSPNFPVTAGVAQTLLGGHENAFVSRLGNDLKSLARSTFLGGNQSDIAFAIALGDYGLVDGLVYVAGYSTSLNFPGTSGGTPRASGGDGFIARLDANLQFHQATYLGGNGANYVWAVGVQEGRVFVAGDTTSTDLYGTEGAVQFYHGGGEDGFVSVLADLGGGTWYTGTPPPQPELVAPPGQVVVVEYFHVGFGHYFITAQADEIAALDAGAFAGWARTGYFFWAWPTSANVPGLVDVCRFFTVAFAPKSSHFYTANAAECAAVKQNPNWIYEKLAFKVALPNAALECAEFDERRLYRLYNSGLTGAPNHRYTTVPEIRALMVAHGFVPEDANTLCTPE